MPKHDPFSPKAIANRIKSKGLQKLRWYCQMCQKQCRDENGFKCHMMSESHQRQLLLVADNPGRFIAGFSEEFLKGYLDILRRQYGTRRVHCNVVYQEYIRDRNHFHMNATRWSTLTGFVKFLGKTGICEVEPTPKGWFIKYIDRSPEALAREAALRKKAKMDCDDEERSQKMVEDQILRALATKRAKGEEEEEEPVYTELQRTDENEKLSFILFGKKEPPPIVSSSTDESMEISTTDACTGGASSSDVTTSSGDVIKVEEQFKRPKPPQETLRPNALKLAEVAAKATSIKPLNKEDRKRKPTAVDRVLMMEEYKREKKNRKDYWIHEGIVVKVLHKKLGDNYYKKKGVITELKDQFTAIVTMLDSGDKIKIDQSFLETVIPAIGKEVLVVNGAYRGLKASLDAVDIDNYCATITIRQGPSRDRVLEKIAYEDISKFHSDS